MLASAPCELLVALPLFELMSGVLLPDAEGAVLLLSVAVALGAARLTAMVLH